MKLVEWSLRDSNAFLLMITSLLLKRKDELVVRQICDIMKMFTRAIPLNQLKSLMKINQKHIQYIFNKISKVSTYFTQVKLLEILHIVLDFLDDKGEKVIKLEKLFATSNISRTMDLFHALDLGNFLNVSLFDLVYARFH